MPLPNELLALLVCPKSKQPLMRLPAGQLDKLNRWITAGQVRDNRDIPLETPLAEALITRNGNTIYPVIDDMPVLLEAHAIHAEALPDWDDTTPQMSDNQQSPKKA